MIAEAAHRQGASVYALDPDSDAPAFAECDGHIIAEYDDLAALEKLGDMTDVLTYEFETYRVTFSVIWKANTISLRELRRFSTPRTACAKRTTPNATASRFRNIFRCRRAPQARTAQKCLTAVAKVNAGVSVR